MAAKEVDYTKETDPWFRVTHRFQTGLTVYDPEDPEKRDVAWVKPPDWNPVNGKHFAEYGPSVTMTPLNEPAKKVMDAMLKKVEERRAAQAAQVNGSTAKLEEMLLKVLRGQMETQAEIRRSAAKLEEAQAEIEKLKAENAALSKKK